MARPARPERRPGRPSGVGSSAVGRRHAVGSGSRATLTTPVTASTAAAPQTRATYRLLLLRGLAPDEAANLTAWICGLQVGSQRWRLAEVNRLLFLRELSQAGRFGIDDGAERVAPAA
jgi:hypothetical protein